MWQAALPVLNGIRVLDLSLQLPGPYATRLLADMGADVHRIEPPGGDPARAFPSLYTEVNVGKEVEEVDLKSDAGLRRVLDLARDCDVLVEGFRPGVLARLGLGYEAVAQANPGVIYCSISGYGQDGERADKPGHDLTYHADAGTLAQDGPSSSSVPPLPIADLASGLMAATTISAALVGRADTGAGAHLDVSIADVMASWTFPVALSRAAREVDLFGSTPHYGVFDTADGHRVALGIVHEQHFWERFCDEFDLADERSSTFEERQRDHQRLRRRLETLFAGLTAAEVIARTTQVDVPAAIVQRPEDVLDSAPFERRGLIRGSGFRGRYAHPVRFATTSTAASPEGDSSTPGATP
ncbi:Crotonobetainyl-CoA:carnitine CoA-transferase CaiB [Nocardioides alpinus]|uniref:CoA transferase n=1 Tax=Nocardioides alpinus TaxID=748909 RepID=A0A1I0VIH1_9ACTN|nr:CaiB/BaiF CoA-transferase family protein [Nocardioides alpinus]PKH37290.1 CoA transferase [Nocardioides alpinus]SFA76175.1 Crotonobetainyl-CoA:carnitine CoA-transferase CaiB [Nocardioides alpinus]